MQTPATTAGSKHGWEISEKQKSSKISEYSTVSSRQRASVWAFEWKVIQHSACHESQSKTSSYWILQHQGCQSLFCFRPVVTSLFMTEGLCETSHSEGENQRVGGLECEADEVHAHLWGMAVLLSARSSTGLWHKWSTHFGCPSISLYKLPKSLWPTNYC